MTGFCASGRKGRRVAGILVACQLAILAGGPAGVTNARAPGGPPSRFGLARTEERRAIQRLLSTRARAVRAGDREAFLSTLAGFSPGFVRRQRRMWEWSQSLPKRSYRLTANWLRLGDLADESLARRYPGAESVSAPVTEERFRFRGYSDGESVDDLFLTFVLIDDRWLIAEDTDFDDVGLQTARHLWDFGPVQEQRSNHFLLLRRTCGNSPCDALGGAWLGLAEEALARVDDAWPVPWRRRLLIEVPADQAELARLIQATFDTENFVAFAYSNIDTTDGFRYTGTFLIVNSEQIVGRAQESLLSIAAHELLHAATRGSSGAFVPTFIEEGLAEYAGHQGSAGALGFLDSEVAAGRFDGELPRDYEFSAGSGTDIFRSYQKAYSAVRFFIRRWGERKFVRFYLRLGRADAAPGTIHHRVDDALRATIGIGLGAFEKQWAVSIA